MKLIFNTVAIFFILHASSAMAKSADASLMDIGGVKLGMSLEEASMAVQNHYEVGRKKIEYNRFLSINSITKKKSVDRFSFKNGNERLVVYFTAQVPFNKLKPMVVSMVHYEIEYTSENSKNLESAVMEKFGKPSAAVFMGYEWCLKPTKNHPSPCYNFRGPSLTLKTNTLQLSDPSYHDAVVKFFRNKKNQKPNF